MRGVFGFPGLPTNLQCVSIGISQEAGPLLEFTSQCLHHEASTVIWQQANVRMQGHDDPCKKHRMMESGSSISEETFVQFLFVVD